MKVLVVGAYGFIGRGVVTALLAQGHEVIGAGRDIALGQRLIPQIKWIYTDFNKDHFAEIWLERFNLIDGAIDGVVNCVGILQSDLQDKAQMVHYVGAKALFDGAERYGVKRLVHISATTIEDSDGETDNKTINTEYALSKMAGELALSETGLNWTIVRPDLVLGMGSNGGALLMRAMAGLPFITPVPGPGTQKFQPIALEDLSDGIVALLTETSDKHQGQKIYAVGPDVVSLKKIIGTYRSWLGFKAVGTIVIPRLFMKLGCLIGDFVSLFGNRTAFRSTSLVQMEHFKFHDPEPFEEILKQPLKTISQSLAQRPAGFSDRQHARTALVWPFLQWVLGLSWIIGGLNYFSNKWQFGFVVPTGFNADLMLDVFSFGYIILGGLFLSRRWMRLAGSILIVFIVIGAIGPLLYLQNISQILQFLLALGLPVLTILLVMGMSEKR